MNNLKKIQKLTLLLAAVVVLTTGCRREIFCVRGEGPSVTETVTLPDFDGIRLALNATVHLTQSATQTVEVTAQENILDEIEYDIRGGVLVIKDKNCINRHSDIIFHIAIPNLTEVTVSGSGEIITDSTFTGLDNLEAKVSGSGNIYLDAEAQSVFLNISGSGEMETNLICNDLEANISGSGNIELTGTADTQDLQISGSGKFRSFDMPTRVCEATISGSGDCEVDVSESLTVRISGSGSVFYEGNPSIDVQISGSGRLVHEP